VAIGPVADATMEGVARRLAAEGFAPSRHAPTAAVEALAAPGLARMQAASAIEALRSLKGPHVLGITETELSDGARPVVYGLGEVNGRCAVFSLAQFRRGGLSDEAGLDRFCAAVLHELAHNVGMVHCRSKGCLMHATHEPAALRQLDLSFCASCRAQWRRRIRA
jgi:archaemetzincin